ncbi:HEAT repeat protein [Aspergillus steynii IBT 23096]|uniref:HEAT repeat protein n=1 Tax=Aspergillus steynii IBT 23096 TaxID=1392250 RepID=A0A2I2G7Z7_9EURO|nr:HEAT repeat protein [Aspergillus steynii IBT 23096]PLB48973.1 HEAT repeat protein [Aspergillus steynii IBT 23096]
MENSRQESFKQLRTPCVELSSTGLKFRGRQASANDVLQALRPVHNVLQDLAKKNELDGKLAEYAFFPLSHIFNETQRISANCLELAVNCLQILIAEGWREGLSPQMGKQLVILLTLIVGGTPNQAKTGETSNSQPLELVVAGFDCLSAIFKVLGGSVAERTIYHEIGTATIVDQTVYVLLEGVVDVKSDEICVSAANALEALYNRITDRVVLASVMPRTVSALVKVLKPSTQTRRSYKLLCLCLQILTRMLRIVLNDQVANAAPDTLTQSEKANDRIILDESWLKATATQMKLALANIIQIRRHERQEVQDSLLELCLMVVEECQETLHESTPIVVDTLVVLSDFEEGQAPNKAFYSLSHTATVYPVVLDSLKNSLHIWITAFPRTMQNNDETAKQWALKQISTAFQILSQLQSGSDILNSSLASGLCDSVAAAVSQSANAPQFLSHDASNDLSLALNSGSQPIDFAPVLLEHRSQQKTLGDLQSMVLRLNTSDSGGDVTRLVINRIHQGHNSVEIAPFWLSLAFLKSNTQASAAFDDFISSDDAGSGSLLSTRASMIEELYYISLPILNEPLADESRDWRVSALALEAVALQSQQLQEAFRPELMDALYPVLQLLASNNSNLQRHAMTCLNILTTSCNYESTSTMIIDNVDYLVNSVALKLNTFDVSPYPPQVLFMMIKLCGVRLIPYLDDLVDSIFGILDLYHGYPKLVEIMFKTLAAIVEEGTKNPTFLAIENGQGRSADHRKEHYKRLHVSTLAEDIANRKAKRAKYAEDPSEEAGNMSHPKQPWTTESKSPEQSDNNINIDDALGQEDSGAPLPPPREPEDQEKPLNKSHNLLLHIVKSIPSHLSSPSPYLRRSLLSILIQVSPLLAAHENSFLPLINDVWPSVAARITFPTSFGPTSSSNSLMTKTPSDETTTPNTKPGSEELDFQEEIYVTTTACLAIEQMCKNAGDFMASRIETEYPRWERLYRRAWDKVSADAERAIERRAQQQQKTETTPSSSPGLLTQSLSLTTTGSTPSGSRAFTPHHNLWRSLLSLFITLLSHVRLPLSTGDQICEFLGAWIARYAGPEYYSVYHLQNEGNRPEGPDIDAIEDAIHAMATWNADLTWFIFQEQKAQVLGLTAKTRTRQLQKPMIVEVEDEPLKTWSMPGSGLKFAALAF